MKTTELQQIIQESIQNILLNEYLENNEINLQWEHELQSLIIKYEKIFQKAGVKGFRKKMNRDLNGFGFANTSDKQ